MSERRGAGRRGRRRGKEGDGETQKRMWQARNTWNHQVAGKAHGTDSALDFRESMAWLRP
jgi:hypothetical protein